ncbi:MAG: YlxR family protein [Candidatus Rokubacteria bacterium]|nr:YlxR family protein [Candidatus Rokubacteria bacterium]
MPREPQRGESGPERTCLGCRQVRPKKMLIRLVRGADGRVRAEAAGMGRGAYVCPTEECLKQALREGRLGHAFKRPTELPAGGPAEVCAAPGDLTRGKEGDRLWQDA